MKTKIDFVEASDIQQLKEELNKLLEAIQVNIKCRVAEIKTIPTTTGYIAQVVYIELEDSLNQVLNEEVVVNVP